MNILNLFIGGCALSGGLIYNAIYNYFNQSLFEEDRKNIFNYGMLYGLSLGSGLVYLKCTERLLLKSSE